MATESTDNASSSHLSLPLCDHEGEGFGAFDASEDAPKPQIKLEVLSARQMNRVVIFNFIVWCIALFIVILRAVLMHTVLLIRKPVTTPNGKVKYLKWYPANHWYYWFEVLGSLILSLFATALAIVFTARIVRSRKKHNITHGQVWAIIMVISLASTMLPFTYIWNIHDFCWLNDDVMNPSPRAWGSGAIPIMPELVGLSWIFKCFAYTGASIFYIWGASHQLGLSEQISTRRMRFRFYGPKIAPLILYTVLRFYAFFAENIVVTMIPLTTVIGMIQNFITIEEWYPRVIVIVMLLTAFELGFVIAILARLRATMKTLRKLNYIKTRIRQVSFRMLLWSSVMTFAVTYLYEIIDRLFRPDYGYIGAWLRKPPLPRYHVFAITGVFGRDLLLVSHALVTAYVHLPIDSVGLAGWFRGSSGETGEESGSDAGPQVVSLDFNEKNIQDGPKSLITKHYSSSCVLPSHVSNFNFTWLAYSWEKENHGGIIPQSASIKLKCQIKHKETDTNVLIFDCTDRIVIAFKGTTSLKNVTTDLKVMMVPLLSSFPTNEQVHQEVSSMREWRNATIHKGFIKAYSAISQQVLQELRELLYGNLRPIFLTGHSLGGALATLCSLDVCLSLPIASSNVVVSTFGSPKCGNRRWREVYERTVQSHWRFAMEDDVVTKMPYSLRYEHVGKQCLLTNEGNLFLDPSGIEGVLWSGKVAGVKNHKKSAYMVYLQGFCGKHLPGFNPEFWDMPLSKEDIETVQTLSKMSCKL